MGSVMLVVLAGGCHKAACQHHTAFLYSAVGAHEAVERC